MNDDPLMVLKNGPISDPRTDQRIRDKLRDELEARLGLDQSGDSLEKDIQLLKNHSPQLDEIFTENPHLLSALHVSFPLHKKFQTSSGLRGISKSTSRRHQLQRSPIISTTSLTKWSRPRRKRYASGQRIALPAKCKFYSIFYWILPSIYQIGFFSIDQRLKMFRETPIFSQVDFFAFMICYLLVGSFWCSLQSCGQNIRRQLWVPFYRVGLSRWWSRFWR